MFDDGRICLARAKSVLKRVMKELYDEMHPMMECARGITTPSGIWIRLSAAQGRMPMTARQRHKRRRLQSAQVGEWAFIR